MPPGAGKFPKIFFFDRRYHYIAVFRAGRLKSIGALFLWKLRLLKAIDKHAEHAVHHREIDTIAAPAAFAREQRGLNRTERVSTAENVTNVDAGIERPLEPVLIRQIDQVEAARRVQHWRIGAARRPRTMLPKARNRAVHQA